MVRSCPAFGRGLRVQFPDFGVEVIERGAQGPWELIVVEQQGVPLCRRRLLTVGLLPGGDRFEDFFDKIGVSLETFRDEFTGGWLFNYVEALRLAGVRTVLLYTSARVEAAVHFTHVDSGAPVWVLPSLVFTRSSETLSAEPGQITPAEAADSFNPIADGGDFGLGVADSI